MSYGGEEKRSEHKQITMWDNLLPLTIMGLISTNLIVAAADVAFSSSSAWSCTKLKQI